MFFGGRGLNVKTLYDEVTPNISPLDPENRIIFGVGPLNSTLFPGSRIEVTAKAPQTGLLGTANAGGTLCGELKFAGYDQVVIKGKSESPVYIWINDGKAEMCDASHMWGKDVWETNRLVKEDIGDRRAKVACIGPAGERLVNVSTIIFDRARAAGRGGLGAVMGSKNLKALAVRGTKSIEIADPDAFMEAVDEINNVLKLSPAYKTYSTLGTIGLFVNASKGGVALH